MAVEPLSIKVTAELDDGAKGSLKKQIQSVLDDVSKSGGKLKKLDASEAASSLKKQVEEAISEIDLGDSISKSLRSSGLSKIGSKLGDEISAGLGDTVRTAIDNALSNHNIGSDIVDTAAITEAISSSVENGIKGFDVSSLVSGLKSLKQMFNGVLDGNKLDSSVERFASNVEELKSSLADIRSHMPDDGIRIVSEEDSGNIQTMIANIEQLVTAMKTISNLDDVLKGAFGEDPFGDSEDSLRSFITDIRDASRSLKEFLTSAGTDTEAGTIGIKEMFESMSSALESTSGFGEFIGILNNISTSMHDVITEMNAMATSVDSVANALAPVASIATMLNESVDFKSIFEVDSDGVSGIKSIVGNIESISALYAPLRAIGPAVMLINGQLQELGGTIDSIVDSIRGGGINVSNIIQIDSGTSDQSRFKYLKAQLEEIVDETERYEKVLNNARSLRSIGDFRDFSVNSFMDISGGDREEAIKMFEDYSVALNKFLSDRNKYMMSQKSFDGDINETNIQKLIDTSKQYLDAQRLFSSYLSDIFSQKGVSLENVDSSGVESATKSLEAFNERSAEARKKVESYADSMSGIAQTESIGSIANSIALLIEEIQTLSAEGGVLIRIAEAFEAIRAALPDDGFKLVGESGSGNVETVTYGIAELTAELHELVSSFSSLDFGNIGVSNVLENVAEEVKEGTSEAGAAIEDAGNEIEEKYTRTINKIMSTVTRHSADGEVIGSTITGFTEDGLKVRQKNSADGVDSYSINETVNLYDKLKASITELQKLEVGQILGRDVNVDRINELKNGIEELRLSIDLFYSDNGDLSRPAALDELINELDEKRKAAVEEAKRVAANKEEGKAQKQVDANLKKQVSIYDKIIALEKEKNSLTAQMDTETSTGNNVEIQSKIREISDKLKEARTVLKELRGFRTGNDRIDAEYVDKFKQNTKDHENEKRLNREAREASKIEVELNKAAEAMANYDNARTKAMTSSSAEESDRLWEDAQKFKQQYESIMESLPQLMEEYSSKFGDSEFSTKLNEMFDSLKDSASSFDADFAARLSNIQKGASMNAIEAMSDEIKKAYEKIAESQQMLDEIEEGSESEGRRSELENTITNLKNEANAIISKLEEKIGQFKSEEDRAAARNAVNERAGSGIFADAGSSDYQSTLTRINNLMYNNSAAANAFNNELAEMRDKLMAGNLTTAGLDQIKARLEQVNKAVKSGWGDNPLKRGLATISGKVGEFASLATVMTGIDRLANRADDAFRTIVSNVRNVDTAMTELKKVTNDTAEGYDELYNKATQSASKIGATVSDTINATADFARLGYNINDSLQLAESAIMYKNVGDGIDSIDEATKSIISTMKGFDIEASNAMDIVDKFNEVGNNFAISSVGVGDALERSAAALSGAGNSIEESIGLVAAANEVIQNPESVGTAMKTLTMYLRAAKTEAETAGIETDGMAESVSKLRDQLKGLTGVDIMIDDHTFKSTYQIVQEISKVWDKLSDASKANVTSLIGGKRNANVIQALMTNFDQAEAAMKVASDAEGSAMLENAKFLDSIEGRMTKLKGTFEDFSNTVLNDSFVKGIVSGGDAILNVINNIIKGFGSISSLGIVTSLLTLSKSFNSFVSVSSSVNSISSLFGAFRENGNKFDVAGITALTSQMGNASAATRMFVYNSMLAKQETLGLSNEFMQATASALGLTLGEDGLSVATQGLGGKFTALGASIKGAFANVMPIISILSMIGFAIGGAINDANQREEASRQQAIENAKQISEGYKTAQEEAKSNIDKLKGYRKEYEKLSTGVEVSDDGSSVENISLTNEEFERYKEIANEVIGINTKLPNSVKSAAEGFDNYNTSIQQSIELQNEYIEKQRELFVANGFGGWTEDYKKNMEEAINTYRDSFYSLFGDNLNMVNPEAYNMIATRYTDNFAFAEFTDIDALQKIYENRKQFIEDIISSLNSDESMTDAEISTLRAKLQSGMALLADDLDNINNDRSKMLEVADTYLNYTAEDRIKNIYKTLTGLMGEETMDSAIASVIKEDSWDETESALITLFTGLENLYTDTINSNDGGILSNIFSKINLFKNNKFDTEEQMRDALAEYNSLVDEFFNAGKPDDINDVVWEFLASYLYKFSNAASVAVESVDNITDSFNKLKDVMSDLDDYSSVNKSVFEDLVNYGHLTASSIKEISDSLEDGESVIDYLKEENGVLKLNEEAWAARKSSSAKDDISNYEKNYEIAKKKIADAFDTAKDAAKEIGKFDTTYFDNMFNSAEDISNALNEFLNGSINIDGRKLTERVNMIEAGGWEDIKDSLYDMFYSTQMEDVEIEGGVVFTLTPIDKDGNELSRGEFEKYYEEITTDVASVQDVLNKDTKGLVMHYTLASEYEGDMTAAEHAEKLASTMIDELSAAMMSDGAYLDTGFGEYLVNTINEEIDAAMSGGDPLIAARNVYNMLELVGKAVPHPEGENSWLLEWLETESGLKEVIDNAADIEPGDLEKYRIGAEMLGLIADEYEGYHFDNITSSIDSVVEAASGVYEAIDTLKEGKKLSQKELYDLAKEDSGILGIEGLFNAKTADEQLKKLEDYSKGYNDKLSDVIENARENVRAKINETNIKIGTEKAKGAEADYKLIDSYNARLETLIETLSFLGSFTGIDISEYFKGDVNKLGITDVLDSIETAFSFIDSANDPTSSISDIIDSAISIVDSWNENVSDMEGSKLSLDNFVSFNKDENGLITGINYQTDAVYKYIEAMTKKSAIDSGMSEDEAEYLATMKATEYSMEHQFDNIDKSISSMDKLDSYLSSIGDAESTYSEKLESATSFINEMNSLGVNIGLSDLIDEAGEFSMESAISAVEGYMDTMANADDSTREHISRIKEELERDLAIKAAIDIDKETSGIDDVASALKESRSEAGLTVEAMKKLENRYKAIDGYDADKLFEHTATGIQLNTAEVNKLEASYQKIQQSKVDQYYNNLIEQYKELKDEIGDMDATAEQQQELNRLESQISEVGNLRAQYEGLTSAFNRWKQAQSGGEESDMYEDATKGLKSAQELRDAGKIGSEEFQAAAEFFLGGTAGKSAQEIADMWDAGQKTMDRYFKDGHDGLNNMVDDLIKYGDAYQDANGNVTIDNENVAEMAEHLGVGEEALTSMLKALRTYGWNVDFLDFDDSFDGLTSKSQAMLDRLSEITGQTYDINVNFDTVEQAEEQITNAGDIIKDLTSGDNAFKLDSREVKSAYALLNSLIQKKLQLEQKPAGLNVDKSKLTTEASTAVSKAENIYNKGRVVQEQLSLGIDTTQAEADFKTAVDSLTTEDKEILASMNLDVDSLTTDYNTAVSTLESTEIKIKAEYELPEDTEGSLDKDATVTYDKDSTEVDGYQPENKTAYVRYVALHASVDAYVSSIRNIDRTITYTYKTVGTKPTGGEAAGTASAIGTAFASGNWGIKGSGVALGGELGTELLVRDGHYYTIGDNGAEFFRYKPGDIVFNAEQTRQLFAYGGIKGAKPRGKMYAVGTAFADGSISASGRAFAASSVNASGSKITTKKKSTSSSKKKKKTTSGKQTEEKRVKALDKIKEKYEKINKELEHMIEHYEFMYDMAEKGLDYKGMGTALDNEASYYQQIMQKSQAAINEMKKKGAKDSDEQLQAMEKSYWDAARKYYDTLEKKNDMLKDALMTQVDDLQKGYEGLKKAEKELNDTGNVTVDTWQALIENGLQYVGALEKTGDGYRINKEKLGQMLAQEKEQLAIEAALNYLNSIKQALLDGEVNKVNALVDANQKISDSSWGVVDAILASLQALGLTGDQINIVTNNIQNLKDITNKVSNDLDFTGEIEKDNEEFDKQADALDRIIELTEELIQQEVNDQKKALDEQLDAYQKLINKKKELLSNTKEETSYEKEVAKAVKEIAELQAQADKLALDDSREAMAKRADILKKIEEKQEALGEKQQDYGIEKQTEALDKAGEEMEERIQKEQDELDESISSEEKRFALAIERIRTQWGTLYKDLIDNNMENGNILNSEITENWEHALEAATKYGDYIAGLSGIYNEILANDDDNDTLRRILGDLTNRGVSISSYGGVPKFHEGGYVDGKGVNGDEVLAILKKGELVLDDNKQGSLFKIIDFHQTLSEKLGRVIGNVSSRIDPMIGNIASGKSLAASAATSSGAVSFNPIINVTIGNVGNMDSAGAREYGRQIADTAIDRLNSAFERKGITNVFSRLK